VVIIGAGGQARVVAAILRSMPDVEVVGAADRSPASVGEDIGGTRVITTIGRLSGLLRKGVAWAVLAIGDNAERARMYEHLRACGFRILTARHPTALVEDDVRIGRGAVICQGAILCTKVVVGANALINTGAIVEHETRVGAHAHVGPGARVAGRVVIGAGSFLGVGCTVRDRVRIGAGSIIGAGSVVVSDIPPRVVAYGVPARAQRHV
jgi:sugar O-acyltransferase (sialic acid O-acetyltransferase NeuD family)